MAINFSFESNQWDGGDGTGTGRTYTGKYLYFEYYQWFHSEKKLSSLPQLVLWCEKSGGPLITEKLREPTGV